MYKVFKFGLLKPSPEEEKLVLEQLFLANRYRNDLIALLREQREKTRQAQNSVDSVALANDKLQAAVAELAELRAQVKKVRSQERKRVEATSELKGQIAVKQKLKKKLSEELKETKRKEKSTLKALYRELENEFHDSERKLRKTYSEKGLYWGTYLLVEAEIEQSRKALLRSLGPENDPRFRRFDRTGIIGVQLQKGLPVGEASENPFVIVSTLLQLGPIDPKAWTDPKRGVRRRESRSFVRFRIGSEGRAPIWAQFPLKMHRPIPAGGVIKQAKITRTRIGKRFRYDLHIGVDVSLVPLHKPTDREKCAAVDLGWRRVDGGLRVAKWVGSDGQVGELVLPERILYELTKANDLRSIRDKLLDQIKPRICAWVSENREKLPEKLAQRTATIAHWRGISRFSGLWHEWRENRFQGDSEIFKAFDEWSHKERHLLDWESALRFKIVNQRIDLYKVFACELSRLYDAVAVEDFDLRKTNQRKPPEEDKQNPSAITRMQSLAAGSILRNCLKNAVASRKGHFFEVSAVDTTAICNVCGKRNGWDQSKCIMHTCQHCGALWDQDVNAANNLLFLALSTLARGEVVGDENDEKLGRWQKRKQQKEQLLETQASAS